MSVRLSKCGCVAIATVVALGLHQLCFNNNATSFISPSAGSKAGMPQSDVKSLPVWMVLASAQPAVAASDASSYDSTVAGVAALTAAFACVVLFQGARNPCKSPSIAGVPSAQQRRQMFVPLGALVAAPPSMSFANEEEADLTAGEKAKKEKAALIKKKKDAEEAERLKKKQEVQEKLKKEKEEKEGKMKKEKEEREAKKQKTKKDEV